MSTTTVNRSLRLTAPLAALVDQAAAEDGISSNAFTCAALYAAVRRPGDLGPEICLGFVELRGGEIDPDDVECPECGQPLKRPHIGFLAASRRPLAYGPVCYICATAE